MYMMIGRVFSMFSAPEDVAYMINFLSGLSSALTILFLFWTITMLGRKLASPNGEIPSGEKMWAVLGSGFVGALAYTFSDTFWFSAVEGEVYAMSSLFTAIVFWAILKWELVAHERFADRWLILIAYLIGLSIGIHLLNLLAIPALGFVYYFKKYKPSLKGMIATGLISVVILGVVQNVIIPYVVILATKFELFFVNSIGLPFNTGTLIYSILVIGGVVYGIMYTHKTNRPKLNTILICFSVLIIGYSSFGMILIRSAANTPIDENDPENTINLTAYLGRDQYGEWPLSYGQYWNTPTEAIVDGKTFYYKDEESGEYVATGVQKKQKYQSQYCTVFPRMWSPGANHIGAYKSWSGYVDPPLGSAGVKIPTFGENLSYFFKYQIGWMYARYFMWNFAGRQNDTQGHGNVLDGNWISGIDFLDEARLGNQGDLPSSMENNKARNHFYFLPLILGLVGLFYQFRKDPRFGFVTFLLFFFTGLAIVLYLNQYPFQPRERDYAYAGSFYAFAIWIGLGVMAIHEFLSNSVKVKGLAFGITGICTLAVPVVMAMEGWDDHDRSGRFTARDFAKNYLDSCEKDAILFTNGDNDTFPLWYVQEVEGYRTDVRIVNLTLLNTDWFANQIRRAAYDGKPVPITIDAAAYRHRNHEFMPFQQKKGLVEGTHVDIKTVVDFVLNPNNKIYLPSYRENVNYFPTKFFSLKVDKQKVIENGTVPPELQDQIVDEIKWKVNKGIFYRRDLLMLNILAEFNWDRPIYFGNTMTRDSYFGLGNYLYQEGFAYRLVPVRVKRDGRMQLPTPDIGTVNSEKMYANMMSFPWGGLDNMLTVSHTVAEGDSILGIASQYHISPKKIRDLNELGDGPLTAGQTLTIETADQPYMEENNRRFLLQAKFNFIKLATTLYNEGDNEKAAAALDKMLEIGISNSQPYDEALYYAADLYQKLGRTETALFLIDQLANRFEEDINFYAKMRSDDVAENHAAIRNSLGYFQNLNRLAGVTSRKATMENRFNALMAAMSQHQEALSRKDREKQMREQEKKNLQKTGGLQGAQPIFLN